ncbi:sensor histidine kinase [Streptomyces sp. AK08-02]|uniref:sensor histidine kinase n=1 Tax=Streptomyces sp. AK08-02 TaxID=3028654 RepID=UPI0029B4BB30|nr:histidine kinase [Streptomyces sp. AK08-02]MDX3752379.1 histidine kinase [Streptomyces sp. AK08-02]
METEYRRTRHWRRQLWDALRPEPKAAPLSRRAVYADLALAVVLTVVALIVAASYPGDGPVRFFPSTQYGSGSVSTRVPGTEVVPPGPPLPPVPPIPRSPSPEDEGSVAPWPLVVLSALPLLARRRYPLAVFGVVLAAAVTIGDEASWITVLTCVMGAYSAVTHSRFRVGAIAAMVVGAVLAGLAFQQAEPLLPGWSSPGVVLLVAGVLAGLVRFWRRRLAADRDRFARLQRTQEEAMRRAVVEERARIAAELHDVVTHNVSVMVIQAGAARKVMDAAPERSKEALLAVEAGGRAAMAELRHVMGLLAAPDTGTGPQETPADGLEPQPGLDRLDALTERVRGAGTPVVVAVSLPPDPLPPGVDLTAYRVVQEALTNTIRHAPGAEASVLIGWTDDRLQIEVGNTRATTIDSPSPQGGSGGDGRGESGGRSDVTGNGRGLIGLRERLAVYGGTLTAGPTLAGGYRVKADVPWRTP